MRAMVRRCGEICLSDSKCIRLIEHLLAAGGEGVVVKNDLAPPEEFVEQSVKRSFIHFIRGAHLSARAVFSRDF